MGCFFLFIDIYFVPLQRYKTIQNNKQLVYLALFGDFLCVWFSFFMLPALILFLVCLLYLCKCWCVQREIVRVDFNVSCQSFMINSGGNTDIVQGHVSCAYSTFECGTEK